MSADKKRRKSPDWLKIFRETARPSLTPISEQNGSASPEKSYHPNQNGHLTHQRSERQTVPRNLNFKSQNNHGRNSNSKDPENGEEVYSTSPRKYPQGPFFVNGFAEPVDPDPTPRRKSTGDEWFAGRRDVLDPTSIDEHMIVSNKGTIRGFKNRVRAGIATFLEQQDGKKDDETGYEKNYKELERGRIVVYTTTMRIVRDTYERCQKVKNILQTHMVRYEERDVFMNRDHQRELCDRLGQIEVNVPHVFADGSLVGNKPHEHPSQMDVNVLLPQVFADGALIGGLSQLEQLNETGELRKIFKHFKKIHVKSTCEKCGGYRYTPCGVCHGSKKSLHRNHFTAEFCALRCMQCDENGLVRCELCLDQQE